MLKLQYLICGSRSWGTPTLRTRAGTARMNMHDRLGCAVHVCKDYAEFVTMNADLIGKPQLRRYWTAIQVLDTETGKTFDPPADLRVVREADLIALQTDAVIGNPPFSGTGTQKNAAFVGDGLAPSASPVPDPLPPAPAPAGNPFGASAAPAKEAPPSPPVPPAAGASDLPPPPVPAKPPRVRKPRPSRAKPKK